MCDILPSLQFMIE